MKALATVVRDLASNRVKVEVAVAGIVTSLLTILGSLLIQSQPIPDILVSLIFGFILVWFGIQLIAILEFYLIKIAERKDVEVKTHAVVERLKAREGKINQVKTLPKPPTSDEDFGDEWK